MFFKSLISISCRVLWGEVERGRREGVGKGCGGRMYRCRREGLPGLHVGTGPGCRKGRGGGGGG